MNQSGFINILIIIGIIIVVGAAGYLTVNQLINRGAPPTPKVCTQDAKQCPDGSYVSRGGPNCQFTACPQPPKPKKNEIRLNEGQRDSSFFLEKIYSDHVTGLNFWEYPVPNEQGHPVTLRIGEATGNGCTITLTLIRIEGNAAIFTKEVRSEDTTPCPICLSGNTLINTPSGLVSVKNLQIGMSIWTIDKSGQRVSGVVQKTSRVQVPPTHRMIRLVLDDGRELLASPGHPTIDGRVVGVLVANEFYDGARVVAVNRVAYGDTATYDILPSGDTGFYWANGILIDSTLH